MRLFTESLCHPKRWRKASHPHRLKWNAFRFHSASRKWHFSFTAPFYEGAFSFAGSGKSARLPRFTGVSYASQWIQN